MLTLLFFIVFVIGSIQIFRQYQYILEYKRDERIFDDYEHEKDKDDLISIVDDGDPGF